MFRLIESAPDAIVVVDREGDILWVNRRTESMFGYVRNELVGRPVEILVPEVHRAGHARKLGEYFSGPTARPMGNGLDFWAQRSDGTRFPVEVSLTPLSTRSRMLVAATIRDLLDAAPLARRLLQLLTEERIEFGADLGRRRDAPRTSTLTLRELEILRLASQGLSTREISKQLTVSPSTVKTHFEHIYSKLNASDRAAAVAHAIRHGLIQ